LNSEQNIAPIWLRGSEGMFIGHRQLVFLIFFLGARSGFAQSSPEVGSGDELQTQIETLRADAAVELGKGKWVEARALYDQLLVLAPHDAAAQRDAGRAGLAAGDFDYAVRVLEQAHHFVGHHQDPELHYLRGEALYALGRVDEARDEHRIAELEIGTGPLARMPKLWLARIHARRGEIQRADVLYESLWPPATLPPDAEVALNHADAHLLVQDWTGAERLLRRFLQRSPDNLRARHMLAWALESTGDLPAEVSVRARLAVDDPSFDAQRDYGRALERAGDYRDALRSYQAAADRASGPDATLTAARDRMRYRLTPEVAGDVGFRSDPTTTAEHLQVGAALPFASRHLLSMVFSHDLAQGGWPVADTAVTTVAASLVLVAPWGGRLMVGGSTWEVNRVPVSNGMPLQETPGLRFGGVGEVDTPVGSALRLDVRGELENQWTEAPITIRENGAATGLTGHVFVFPVPSSRRVIIDAGTQARRLTLAPGASGAARPEASQLLSWAGVDFVAWQDPVHTLRGQILDENLVRQTEVAESVTFSLRHYELFGRSDPEFDRRLALLPRSSIDSMSLVIRNALGGGLFGIEVRGGLGYERTHRDVLSQGGLTFSLAASAASRVTASYDIAQETITGLTGRRHSGWVAYHVDL
jgi:Flp pilus assembly protein TadD